MDPYAILREKYWPEEQIIKTIRASLEKNKPLSMVRIGDGECYVLAQEKVLPVEWIKRKIYWANDPLYCGTTIPNLAARDRCLKAVRNADLVGVFVNEEVPQAIFKAYQLKTNNIFYAFMNVGLPMSKNFVQLMIDYPPLLVGRPAESFAQLLDEQLGIKVRWLNAIETYDDVDSCIKTMAQIPHRWSLISAGINALIIADEMSVKYGKVAIDFGHAPDMVLNNQQYYLAKP